MQSIDDVIEAVKNAVPKKFEVTSVNVQVRKSFDPDDRSSRVLEAAVFYRYMGEESNTSAVLYDFGAAQNVDNLISEVKKEFLGIEQSLNKKESKIGI